jgi:hypothetical protein
VPLLEKLYPCAMRKLVCAHKANNTLLIMGVINCESRALVMLRANDALDTPLPQPLSA